MAKFRKKPVVIEAVQYGPYSMPTVELVEFLEDVHCSIGSEGLVIETLEGNMLASVGDWVIKGVNGEFYPCKPDIFEKTYDVVEPGTDSGGSSPQDTDSTETVKAEPETIEPMTDLSAAEIQPLADQASQAFDYYQLNGGYTPPPAETD